MKTGGPHFGASEKARNGFTLVELLVAVAVFAILASLLLPTLTHARHAADSAVCKNNLRQWGIMLRMYVEQWNVYPPDGLDDGPGAGMWSERLTRGARLPDLEWSFFNDGVVPRPPKAIQYCPGLSRTPLRGPDAQGLIVELGCYGYNNWAGLGGYKIQPRPVPTESFSSPNNYHVTAETEVACPSNLIGIADGVICASKFSYPGACWIFYTLGPYYYEITGDLGINGGWGYYSPEEIKTVRTAVNRRHSARWNVLFCDGHSELFTLKQFGDTRIDAVRQRWNLSNLP